NVHRPLQTKAHPSNNLIASPWASSGGWWTWSVVLLRAVFCSRSSARVKAVPDSKSGLLPFASALHVLVELAQRKEIWGDAPQVLSARISGVSTAGEHQT